MDNTTFGGDVPTVPQWSGAPRSIVQVQTILYASLTASLFSAFLAMLGKQWLNRYASVGMRGSAVERGQDRQRKLNGIIVWYFDHVMESLPLMLQVALLLFNCALSRYLWEINTTIASVVLGVTSFGVIFYLFIVAAGTVSVSCPYQTPGSRVLRSAASAGLAAISACRRVIGRSHTAVMLRVNVGYHRPWLSGNRTTSFLKDVLHEIPRVLAIDAFHLGRATVWLPVASARGVYTWLLRTVSALKQDSDEQTTVLDLHCIFWMLQTSLDKDVHLLALEYLTTMVALANFNPTLVVDCFDVLIGCVKVVDGDVVTTQGPERLAMVSATSLLRTFAHLSAMDPTSAILADVHQRYIGVFPPGIRFDSLPFSHTFGAIHSLFYPHQRYWWIQQRDSRSSDQEHAIVIRALAELAESKYRRRRNGRNKVPRWILASVMHSLVQNPPLPLLAVVDCLLIIAIELGCDVSSTGTMASEDRCVHTLHTLISLTWNQHQTGEGFGPDNSETRNHDRNR
jgi:hypothetical protein